MAERSTDGLEGLGLKAVSDILPEPSEDGIDPVVPPGSMGSSSNAIVPGDYLTAYLPSRTVFPSTFLGSS